MAYTCIFQFFKFNPYMFKASVLFVDSAVLDQEAPQKAASDQDLICFFTECYFKYQTTIHKTEMDWSNNY